MSGDGRDAKGRFRKGNQLARRLGLWSQKIPVDSRHKAQRVKHFLLKAGLTSDVAAALTVAFVHAERVTLDCLAIEDAERRLELFPTFDRATRIMLSIMAQRERALAAPMTGPVPTFAEQVAQHEAMRQTFGVAGEEDSDGD